MYTIYACIHTDHNDDNDNNNIGFKAGLICDQGVQDLNQGMQKSYKSFDLQQKYKSLKEIIGCVYFLIDQSTHDLWYEYFSNFFPKKKKIIISMSVSLYILTNMLEKYHIFQINIYKSWI